MDKEDYKMIDVTDIFEEVMKASKPKQTKHTSIHSQRKMKKIQKMMINTLFGKRMVSDEKED